MPSYQSLRNAQEFRRVLANGTRRRVGPMVVVSSPGPTDYPRLGLVVSKNCGSAVERNRIKRRLRHATRSVGLKPGIDYVIIASKQVLDTPFDRLTGWLARAVEESLDA